MLSSRFKVMCADAGLTVDAVAKLLHVSSRTVYAWFSGRTAIPYAAYKLVRILGRYELPGTSWRGWLMHSGKLWTPEGYGFDPHDSTWWSLLVRQARCFRAAYQRAGDLEKAIMELAATSHTSVAQAVMPGAVVATDAPGKATPHGAAAPAAANLFLVHFTTDTVEKGDLQREDLPSYAMLVDANKTEVAYA